MGCKEFKEVYLQCSCVARVSIVSCFIAFLVSGCSSDGDTEQSEQPFTLAMDFAGSEEQQRAACERVATLAPQSSSAEYIGNIWREELETDTDFLQYWQQVTPENAGKWGQVEATRDMFDWQRLDAATTFANNNAISFKHHTLVWGGNQPQWLDTLTPQEQAIEIEQWLLSLAERYPAVSQVDVVNEPLHSIPVYREALETFGAGGLIQPPGRWSWVVNAFIRSRTLFPQSELLLNDFNIVRSDENTTEYLELISLLLQQDLIDGIGIQAHFLEEAAVGTVARNLERLGATGLPVYVSEFDLNIEDDTKQMQKLSELFQLFYRSRYVRGITFWGYRENQHWQPNAHLIRSDGSKRPSMKWLECYLSG